MESSRYNIVSRIKDSDEYFIINPLYGNADIIDQKTYHLLVEEKRLDQEFIEKNYIVDRQFENDYFRNAYLKFLDQRDAEEIQLFFVPWYSCNFDCSYCYQDGYKRAGFSVTTEVTDAFYRYIDTYFAGRSKYITLFGGEPFLSGEKQRCHTGIFFDRASERKIDVSVVTNGYHVTDYLEMIKKARIREIQVTLDGTREVHDRRRKLKKGTGTFDRIVEGIDLLLNNGINVNLRVVIDRENIDNLPGLAEFAINRGWTSSPFFSTQLGRNYELHHGQEKPESLYSRIELYAALYRIIERHSWFLDFHTPSFSVAGNLFRNGELPDPLFDACPGTKTEWAFDFTGKIYACTATVGKKGEELGTFFPEWFLDDNKVDLWNGRDVLSMDRCRQCNLSLICGGGCAAVAKNQNGCINSPDCRPVTELLEYGISAYFNEGKRVPGVRFK